MVHAHHKHGGINRRSSDELFGSTLQVSSSLLQGSKDTGGLQNMFSTSITPFNVRRISVLKDGDALSIDDKLPGLSLDHALELALGGIILEHVNQVVEVSERITGNNDNFARVKGIPGDQALDTAKFLYSNLHHISDTQLPVKWGGGDREPNQDFLDRSYRKSCVAMRQNVVYYF